jgi:hypothetical protein
MSWHRGARSLVVSPKLGIEVFESDRLADIFAEVRERIDALERGTVIKHKGEPDIEIPSLEELVRLAAAARRDGFPTQSMRGSSRSTVLDEDKMPIAPISDPTGELASAEGRIVDPIKAHLQRVMRGLTGAVGDLRMASAAMVSSSQYVDVGLGEPRCASCARINEWATVHRSERCRWCYDFWLRWRRDPPIELLRDRRDGKRITSHMEREAFMPPKAKVHNG